MQEERPPRLMLTDWKAIARHFSRDSRTVQRWERDEGLPIHRHSHHQRSSVYAYVDELDAWWRERGTPSTGASDGVRLPPTRSAARARVRRLLVAAVAGIGLVVAFGVAVRWPTRSRLPEAADDQIWSVIDGGTAEAWLAPGPIADVNGDGVADLVLSAAHAREVFMIFGRTSLGTGPLRALADVTLRGADHGQHTGSLAGDFDGDGLSDLLIGVVLYEPEAFRSTGPVYAVRGRRAWPATLQLPADADWAFRFSGPKDVRMVPCASDGPLDLNQDGLDDTVLGAVDYSPAGRASGGGVFVFFGRREWPAVLDVERDADITILGSRSGEGLSGACAVGDLNGDARPDLALLAREETLWGLLGGRGRYYVFFGRDHWPRVMDASADADLTVTGPGPNAVLAPPVVADLNGDGLMDLIGASSLGTSGPPGAGEIAGFWGRRGPWPGVQRMEDANVLIRGDAPDAALGRAVAAADLDSDGIDDLLLVDSGRGQFHVVFGRREWPRNARLSDLRPRRLLEADRGVGDAGLRVGKARTDGLPEVLITSPFAVVSGHGRTGRAWLVKPQRPLVIDVHPGHQPNVVFRPGVLAIRIAGAAVPAGDRIEPATARVSGIAPTREVWRDFDGDGLEDLQLYFNTAALPLTPATSSLRLTARTKMGLIVTGTDPIAVTSGADDALSAGPEPTDGLTVEHRQGLDRRDADSLRGRR